MSDFLTQLKATKTDEEREWLVMKFSLESLEPAVLQTVWAAAVLHWFDSDLLAALMGRGDDEAFADSFAKLVSLTFVERFHGRGYNIHERSRKLMLKHLWKDNQAQFRELNKRAAQYCAQQGERDTKWRIATLYHRLLADEPDAVDDFIKQGVTWANVFKHVNLEELVRKVVVEAEAKRLPARTAAWAYSFQADCDLRYSQFESARKNLMLAIATCPQDLQLRAQTKQSLGIVSLLTHEGYDEARSDLNEALQAYGKTENRLGEAQCTFWLGEINRLLGERDLARQKYREALKLYRQEDDKVGVASSSMALGKIELALGAPEQARQLFEEAVAVFRQVGDKLDESVAVKSLGDVSLSMQEFEEAQENYEESLKLCRQINYKLGEANSIARLGEMHELQGAYAKAKARAEEALEIYKEVGDKLGERNCERRLERIRSK